MITYKVLHMKDSNKALFTCKALFYTKLKTLYNILIQFFPVLLTVFEIGAQTLQFTTKWHWKNPLFSLHKIHTSTKNDFINYEDLKDLYFLN